MSSRRSSARGRNRWGGLGVSPTAFELEVVSDVLGHSSIAITGDVCGHVSPDDSAEGMATLGAVLDNWG